MIKKLSTLLLLALVSVPVLAQTFGNSDGATFAPKKGQWQVSVFLGGRNNFYQEGTNMDYRLLPQNTNTGGNVGIGTSGNQSQDPGVFLNINGLNGNSLTNIAGLEGKYFVSDNWDINFQFSMDINLTPKKDFVEGDYDIEDMVIPGQSYINARMTNNWYVGIGSNRYFTTGNARIHPYLGGQLGFQMARIETTEPYTGDTSWDDDLDEGLPSQLYMSGSKAGQAFGFKAAGVAGIEYSLADGLVLGFQFQPLAYRYDLIQICPKGFDKYNASHHNIKVFDMPMMKIGFRF